MFCFEFFNLLFSLQKKNRKNRAQIQVNCRLGVNNNILEMFKMIKEEDNNLNSQNLLNNQELISKGIVLMMAMNWTMMKIMLVFRISQLILKKAMDKRELIASTETAILIVMWINAKIIKISIITTTSLRTLIMLGMMCLLEETNRRSWIIH